MFIEQSILFQGTDSIQSTKDQRLQRKIMSTTKAGASHVTGQAAILRTGVVLPKKHPVDPSLYYVSFGEKTSSASGRLDAGVWCNNGINGFVRYRDAENNPVSYGSYLPIQPYSPVNVLMSNGGLGMNTIIGFQNTNTSTPDINNTDGLHVLGQSPLGSTVELDDKLGAIRILHNQGAEAIALSDDLIQLELNTGDNSGKTGNTGISVRKGAIVFKLPDSQMQFDESGLSVSFDDGGTSMKITKKGVVFEGCEIFKVASNEQVSLKGSKMTLEGTKDASLTASELKVGGKQLTNITGSLINIESIQTISLKSLSINMWAWTKLQEFAAMKDSTVLGTDVRTAAIIADAASSYNVTSGTYAVASGLMALDANIVSNMGVGAAIALPAYAGSKAAHVATHAALTTMGTAMLLKLVPMTAMNKILADTLAGTSEPAQEPSGNASGARDKNDKKSFSSVISTEFMKNREVMGEFSVVPNLVARSASSLTGSIPYSNLGATSAIGTANFASSSAYVPSAVNSKNKIIKNLSKYSGKRK